MGGGSAARVGGGGKAWVIVLVPVVAPVVLAGARDGLVAVYLASQGFSFRCLTALRVATSTWGVYMGVLSPESAPPIKNPLHTLPPFPPG